MRIFAGVMVGLRMILAAGAANLKTSEALHLLSLIEKTKTKLQSKAFRTSDNV